MRLRGAGSGRGALNRGDLGGGRSRGGAGLGSAVDSVGGSVGRYFDDLRFLWIFVVLLGLFARRLRLARDSYQCRVGWIGS